MQPHNPTQQAHPSLQNKSVPIKDFLLSPPLYDLTPPPPTAYPKAYRIALDPTRHYTHKVLPSFLASSKPLLTHADIGLPVEEMVLYSAHYQNDEGELHPDD